MFPEDYQRLGPWPGPVPYREGDPHYRGRAKDVSRVRGIIDSVAPLLLITGNSGTGKTSFLQAAIIPALRAERARAITEYGNKTATPAVLVVRDWLLRRGQKEQRDHNTILIEAIKSSIEALSSAIDELYPEEQTIQEIVKTDCEAMKAMLVVDTSWTAYDYITGLAQKVGSLLLCMDQFEEVLQGSEERRVGILNTIADLAKAQLYERENFIQILLSFRQEFWFLFQHLDRRVGNLAKATIYLEDMPEAEVRGVVLQSAQSGGVKISEEAVNELLKWMKEAQREESLPKSVSPPQDGMPPQGAGRPASVDLLNLQALLQELYLLASRKTKPPKQVTITKATLNRLLKLEKKQSGNQELTGGKLAQSALTLFIERRALPLPLVKSTPAKQKWVRLSAESGLPRGLSLSVEEELQARLQQRRIVARMAPFFSSLGLKVQQFEAHLVAAALREDLDTLGLSAENVEEFLRKVGLEKAVRSGDLKGLKELEDGKIDREKGVLSGRARVRKRTKWSYSDAVKRLLQVSRTSLDRLTNINVNILRHKETRQGDVYELVHDGFGPALSKWAEEVRRDPLDALGSAIAQRGVAFRWKKLGGAVEGVCWRGCYIEPPTGCNDPLLFNNVEWHDCDLRGTVFDRCRFKGGMFRNCDLHGALFTNCTFTGSPDKDKPFEFNGVKANGLTFLGCSLKNVKFVQCNQITKMLWDITAEGKKLEISNVTFIDCHPLYQWTIEKEALVRTGPLHLLNCDLVLCDLQHLPCESDRDKDIHRCTFVTCLLHPTLTNFIDKSFPDNELVTKVETEV